MQSHKIADYMNHRPVIFTARMSIETAVEKLLTSGQRGGPVVDDNNRVIGFISEHDCLEAMLRDTYHKEQSATVGDCMYCGDVLTVAGYENITDLAQRMDRKRPKIYPVLDENRKLIGIITRTDVLKAINLQLRDSYSKR